MKLGKTLINLLGLGICWSNVYADESIDRLNLAPIISRSVSVKTVYELPGVKREDIKLEEISISLKFPIFDFSFLDSDKSESGIELLTNNDRESIVKEMKADGDLVYFDKGSNKAFAVYDGVKNRKIIRDLDEMVLHSFFVGDRKIYALDDFPEKKRIETVLPLDVNDRVGLLDNKLLFDLSSGDILYRSESKIVGFNNGYIICEDKTGYSLVNIISNDKKKIWDPDVRSDFFISDNGKYCVSKLKIDDEEFVDLFDVSKGIGRPFVLKSGWISGIKDDGSVVIEGGYDKDLSKLPYY